MKQKQAVALLTLTSLALAGIPAPMVSAQAAVASVRLSASRGVVEYLDTGGRWVRLKGSLNAAEGTAVRTAPGAEMQATFDDGSTMTLGETSAMRFSRLQQTGGHSEIGVRMLGQLTASMSPRRVLNDTVTVDMPVARATINKAFATARAVREDVASTVAVLQLQTPTARAVRMAVTQGAATLHPLYNIAGVITSTDVAHSTFTITENNTGRARRVFVGPSTLLAQRDPASTRAHRTPAQVMEALSARVPVIVYGDPLSVEGPGDDAGDSRSVAAVNIFPEDGSNYLSAEDYVNQAGGWAPPSTGSSVASNSPGNTFSSTPVGGGVPVTSGFTGIVAAGSAPVVTAGVAVTGGISTGITSMVAPAAGSIGAVVLPVVAGIAVVSTVAIVSTNNNRNNNNVPPPPPTSDTGNLFVTVNRGVRSRGRVLNRIDLGSTPVASSGSLGTSILASAPFHGGATGPTLSALGGDSPALVGRLPLSRRMQLHAGASVNRADMFSNMLEVDLGIDYLLDATHSLGAGVRTSSYNVMDPLGNASSLSTSTPELRYTVRY